MTNLKRRLDTLETKSGAGLHTGGIRIIKDGELTQDQERQVAEAEAAGKLVIIREIVSP